MHGFHKVVDKESCAINCGTEETKNFLAMLLDFCDAMSYGALALDSFGLLEYQIFLASLESLPLEARNFVVIPTNDMLETQRWFRDF